MARPLPWVQNVALSLLETVVRRDWEGQGQWVTRLADDRFLDRILLPGVQEQVDVTFDPLSADQLTALRILQARLTLTASLAEAPPGHAAQNAVLTLLPRLRQSWFFLLPHYLRDRHRMRSLLDCGTGTDTAAHHYHNLLLPALQTYSNLLVCHEDSVYALEQAVDFIVASESVIKPLLESGAQVRDELLPRHLAEKVVHVTRLFQRVAQGYARQCDSSDTPPPDKCKLPDELLEDCTAQLIEQTLFFFTGDRSNPVRVPDERARMYADPNQKERMQLWGTTVQIVRNVVSTLYLQLKHQPQARAPQPASLNSIRELRELGRGGAYAECLSVCVEQLRMAEAVTHQSHVQRDPRVAREIGNLFAIAKMLVAILFHVGVRTVALSETLRRLEALARARQELSVADDYAVKHSEDSAKYFATLRSRLELYFARRSN